MVTGQSIWYANWLMEEEPNTAKIWGKAELTVDNDLGKWEISWHGWQTPTNNQQYQDLQKPVCQNVTFLHTKRANIMLFGWVMSPTKYPIYQALTEKCRDSVGNLPMKGALFVVSLFCLKNKIFTIS